MDKDKVKMEGEEASAVLVHDMKGTMSKCRH